MKQKKQIFWDDDKAEIAPGLIAESKLMLQGDNLDFRVKVYDANGKLLYSFRKIVPKSYWDNALAVLQKKGLAEFKFVDTKCLFGLHDENTVEILLITSTHTHGDFVLIKRCSLDVLLGRP